MTPARRGTSAVLPIALAVGVFGASWGVVAVDGGLPGWQAVLASATIFAGSAQFAAVAVAATGGGLVAVVAAGALLNLRYVVLGAATAGALPGRLWRRLLASQLVVDESYALAVREGTPERPDVGTLLRVGALLWLCWTGGTALGVALGSTVGSPSRLGLDAAFPALFLLLLRELVRDRGQLTGALAGGAVALALAPITPAGVPLAVAAIVGLVLSR
jgi:predicted branched-subunit amino acid permease